MSWSCFSIGSAQDKAQDSPPLPPITQKSLPFWTHSFAATAQMCHQSTSIMDLKAASPTFSTKQVTLSHPLSPPPSCLQQSDVETAGETEPKQGN